ncbi:MAG: N-acetylmuramoyl-L-alanine amidase [Bacteroidales bacterium]|nr:N-acetylmuramoyl-L-alanine amidase [Bacteroidales bacterium]
MKRFIIYFGIIIIVLFCQSSTFSQNIKIDKVVIDAGHGGRDPGASGKNCHEKDIALKIALKTGHYIEKNLPDVKVIYTRKTDKFVKLSRRAQIANENNADLFISIHCNANNSSKIYGTETYIMGNHKSAANLEVAKKENAAILNEEDSLDDYEGFDPNSTEAYIMFSLFQSEYQEQSRNIAHKVQKQFKERVGLKDRSVLQAGFWVLFKTAMPGILIETGYLSNPKDEKYLNSDKGQTYIASAIYRAFKEYKHEMEQFAHPENGSVNYEYHEIVADQENIQKKDTTNNKNSVIQNRIVFKVQFATSAKKLKTGSPEFKGMKNVESYFHKGLYKYTVGNKSSIDEANQLKKTIQKNGFRKAFVIAFLNDKRITLKKARKLINN